MYLKIVTTIALIIGINMAWIIQLGSGVNITAVQGGDVSDYTTGASEFNWKALRSLMRYK